MNSVSPARRSPTGGELNCYAVHVHHKSRKDMMASPKGQVRARKGDLVQIHIVVLEPPQRAAGLPEATRSVPYEGWIKGFLLEEEASIGDRVHVASLIGRELSGVLAEINPVYDHGFGEPQAELNAIGPEAWKVLQSGEGV